MKAPSVILHRSFIVHQIGREPFELMETSVADAKAKLRAMAREELIRCRLRLKSGTLHTIGADNYLVTIGKDRRSSVWTSLKLEVQS